MTSAVTSDHPVRPQIQKEAGRFFGSDSQKVQRILTTICTWRQGSVVILLPATVRFCQAGDREVDLQIAGTGISVPAGSGFLAIASSRISSSWLPRGGGADPAWIAGSQAPDSQTGNGMCRAGSRLMNLRQDIKALDPIPSH
jgi:hypothetical protein